MIGESVDVPGGEARIIEEYERAYVAKLKLCGVIQNVTVTKEFVADQQ